VIIDERKKTSLQKRLAQLTNVELFVLADTETEIFDFVKEAVPNWQNLPVYRLSESDKIIAFFQRRLEATKPKLNGLVLAGGKSERMGFDKGVVDWHGKEQRYYMADMLAMFCEEVFISCRADQSGQLDHGYKGLKDTFTGLGPYGGILSAFREQPDNAWLVVACDLPLLSEKTLQYLIEHRNTATIATAYQSSSSEFPEPLITIWEPKSYPVLLSFLAQGYSCPRKVLINSDITVLNAPFPAELTNVNTPQQFEEIKLLLDGKIPV
jgi:molybdopterin-guanine dinucleotide biosynthesis protein A